MRRNWQSWQDLRSGAPLAALLVLGSLLVGCLPLRFSVSPDGKAAIAREEGVFVVPLSGSGEATLVHRSAKGEQPLAARWSDDGKRLLYVVRSGERRRVVIRSWPTGEPSTLLETGLPIAGVSIAPNNKAVAVVLAPTAGRPSLVLLQSDTGRELARIPDIAPSHAWLASANGLHAIRVLRRDVGGTVQAQLVRIDTAGQVRPLARVVVGETCHLAYSRARKTVAVVALAMGKDPAQPLTPEADAPRRLFLYRGGKIQTLDGARPHWAVFAPGGDRLLIDSGDARSALLLLDLRRQPLQPKQLATGIAARTARVGDRTPFLPGWLADGKSLVYWRYQSTFGGSAARSLRAVLLPIDGTPRDLVPAIERAVRGALE